MCRGLEVISLPIELAIPADRRLRLKKEFKNTARNDFFRWLILNHNKSARDFLELTKEEAVAIAEKGLLGLPGVRRQLLPPLSVDHITPLGFGGSNEPENLCIVPIAIDALKTNFIKAQLQRDPGATSVEILVPPRLSSGKFNPIPEFPLEFYYRGPRSPFFVRDSKF